MGALLTTHDEFLINATHSGLMALFLEDEQKTPWEPYHVRGILNPGPGQFFADSIKIRNSDGTERTFPFHENPGPHLIYAGVQCYLNYP